MKIIKHGTAPANREYEVTCKHCGCVFTATESEFRYHHDRDYWTIRCPETDCGTTCYHYNLYRN